MPNESTHTYEVTYVPAGCKSYTIGMRLRLTVVDPPPTSITLNYSGACNGVIATLIS